MDARGGRDEKGCSCSGTWGTGTRGGGAGGCGAGDGGRVSASREQAAAEVGVLRELWNTHTTRDLHLR